MNKILIAILTSALLAGASIAAFADDASPSTKKLPPQEDGKQVSADAIAATQPATGSATRPADNTDPIVNIGPPGGGGIGPKGQVFGAGGNARKIVFLCDASGTMINKIAALKDEINKTIVNLKPIQSFDIIFYQDVKVDLMSPDMLSATPEFKRKATSFLEGQTATGVADPAPALVKALQLKPELLYFLTCDADFPDKEAVLKVIKKYNGDRKTKINTILFVENHAEHENNADSETLMMQIAKESGGNFRWVEMDSMQ